MPVQIGAKPDSGFDDPLGMLRDCHRRIERFLDVLCRIAQDARGRALSTEEAGSVEAALRYFRESGPRHNADEEESLFPRLRASPEGGNPGAVDRLEAEHQTAARLHDSVEELCRAWIADGSLSEADAESLSATTGALRSMYAGHIRVEEEQVFPRAAAVLNRAALAAMGQEFQARRR
jgi:hemerythrin-like domain-containing protein